MDVTEANGCVFPFRRYNGQRVVTLKDIDILHNRPGGTARRNFNANKSRFIEGKDFYILEQPKEIISLDLGYPQGGAPARIVLMTESGYLMLIKSFTDNLAWETQRRLVSGYF